MINFEFKQKCYSCFACKDQCPTGAITMDEDLHPVIDEEKCVDCSLCENVCMEQNPPVTSDSFTCKAAYVVKNKEDAIRRLSSSGGVFFQIAQNVIQTGGYVCGCVYDERFMPKHILTNDIETCKLMMGSKYVKSDLGGCIAQMKRLVSEGNTVLFTGVPCQVAAVKRSIQDKKLLSIAVVCHGSMEPDIWKKYLEEEAKSGKIKSVSMRDKSKGYLNYGLKFVFEDNSEHITYRQKDGYFLKCFTDGLMERERCLTCAYKEEKIVSDLLLGDAWGMEKVFPEFVDDYGCSAVLILTSEGMRLFEAVSDAFDQKSVESDVLIRNNPRITSPAPRNPFRNSFLRKAGKRTSDLHRLTEKYAKTSLFNRIKWKMAGVIFK